MSRWAYHMARETIRGIESMRRAREADERRAWREHVRAQREAQKQAIREYQGARQSEAEWRTQEAEERVEEIRSILRSSPLASCRDWRSFILLEGIVLPPFVPPTRLVEPLRAPSEREFVGPVGELHVLLRWLPVLRRRHAARVADAKSRFWQATTAHAKAKAQRQAQLKSLKACHETALQELRAMIDGFHGRAEATRSRAVDGDPVAIADLISAALSPDTGVLTNESFPICRTSIVVADHDVVVDVEVPDPLDVVPDRSRFRYVKKSDEIREIATSERATNSTYRDYLAAVLLVVARAALIVSEGTDVRAVTCNAWRGFAGDGQCIASLRAERGGWTDLDITQLSAWEFFRGQRGRMAAKPAGDVGVTPFRSPTDDAVAPEDDLLGERDTVLLALQRLEHGEGQSGET